MKGTPSDPPTRYGGNVVKDNAGEGAEGMLVLSRKAEESIVVDGRITITIMRVKGNKVQVGVEAPEEVHILRGELTAKPAPSLAESQP